ncbi:UDP-N-acetylmuramoylalanine--D-glutamate ligase [Anaerobacterium chartisolvens]|uniref:UDP-N-acetylmuramoylalanine--D-glutamate ligase n=1 Tax=Anaerobacterium chartisolvens TaxID=1297424 RepID=A0A369B4A7_9FIRM|nr:UDP-N-acetylmuramoyl-L-alanine--D-glutamate ligase [Anaerobacterium chartisolvens]RCX16369.1 UDP-N-acetylmuramoylalanine--D-glutamate ligase [Anaerobacterium chartisolvens]
MYNKIEEFKKHIKNKKVAVLGIGVSNRPLIKFLHKAGADITAFDRRDREGLADGLRELGECDIKYSLGEGYLRGLNGFDVIFRTPGMRFDIPELVNAKNEGSEVTSEMEVFFELCPAEIFAVTGSDGKTTTTTLIYNMLKEEGYRCWLGGNIGIPLLGRVEEIAADDKVVLELSSFQLHTMDRSPHIAVITNLSPNHLDVHKSMEEYVDAKKNIFRFQNKTDVLVLNHDNEITKCFKGEANGEVKYFSRVNAVEKGCFVKDGSIVYKSGQAEERIAEVGDIAIPGVHNIENYLAAISAVISYVSPETVRKVARSFKGVEHRIELVREVGGVKFYNDSIASSPSRTIAGLNSFDKKVILICGGKDKGIPYDDIGQPIADRVKVLVLIGATSGKIQRALKAASERSGRGSDIPVFMCGTYEQAVKTAYDNAQEGDIVLLSPASTSFDMFKNFEERGKTFKKIVNSL